MHLCKIHITSDALNFIVNTVVIQYCVYYEIYCIRRYVRYCNDIMWACLLQMANLVSGYILSSHHELKKKTSLTVHTVYTGRDLVKINLCACTVRQARNEVRNGSSLCYSSQLRCVP